MMKTKIYIKRPQEYEVVQYTGENGKEIIDWSKDVLFEETDEKFTDFKYLSSSNSNYFYAPKDYYILKVGEENGVVFMSYSPEDFSRNYQLLK